MQAWILALQITTEQQSYKLLVASTLSALIAHRILPERTKKKVALVTLKISPSRPNTSEEPSRFNQTNHTLCTQEAESNDFFRNHCSISYPSPTPPAPRRTMRLVCRFPA